MATIVRPAAATLDELAVAVPHVTVRGLRKSFGAATIYDGFDVDIPRGRFVSIFGPNGCGKSTLINLIAGLIPADGGDIRIGGKPLRETRIGYVFQNYREALFPWLRAIDNIEYPLKIAKVPKAERRARVERLIAKFDVKINLNRYPLTKCPAGSSSSCRSCARLSSSRRCSFWTNRSPLSTTR